MFIEQTITAVRLKIKVPRIDIMLVKVQRLLYFSLGMFSKIVDAPKQIPQIQEMQIITALIRRELLFR